MSEDSQRTRTRDRIGPQSLYRSMDRLAVTWSVGIAIGYAFLISLTCWIAYRVFLVYNAFHAADYAFVVSEVKNDLLICAGYFGVAGVLRYAGHI